MSYFYHLLEEMHPFRYSINLRLPITNPNLLNSILIHLYNGRLWIQSRSPLVDLFDFILGDVNDGLMFFNCFGCCIVEENSFVVELLDESPVAFLKWRFGRPWSHLWLIFNRSKFKHKNQHHSTMNYLKVFSILVAICYV